jgi:psiF repeat
MKHFVVGAFLIGALLAAGGARAENAQQHKMKDCNAQATAKKLTGADRQTFMTHCLKAGGGGTQLSAQHKKMKDCNAQAAQQHLKGKDRKTFMSTCLSGKAVN